ncbi:MAG: HAMP domain-containing sensor histidine kinase [Actinoplanes sp.]
MIGAIDRNTRALRTVVEDLLELAGLECGQLPLTVTELDLTAVVDAGVRAAEPAATANDVRLHTDLPPALHLPGDVGRLRRVVDHLLSNAITYSPGGGAVHVRLTADDTVAELRITDSGIGIPAEEQHRLFDRFYRATNVRHQGFLGSGLGLPMVQTVAALHHGSITLDTAHHPGTAFVLRLPVSRNRSSPDPAA